MNHFSRKCQKFVLISGSMLAVYQSQKNSHFFFGKSKTPEPAEDTSLNKSNAYIWGNGLYISRPDWRLTFENWIPKKITHSINDKNEISEDVKKFKDVILRKTDGFGLDTNGKIWTFKNRQIPSFNDEKDLSNFYETKNTKLNLDQTISGVKDISSTFKAKKIVNTKKLLWALSVEGDLYSYPIVKEGSTNDTQITDKQGWRKVSSMKNLADISCGKEHILMLEKSGSLFAMGKDNQGQCAGGKEIRDIGSPQIKKKIPNPEKVKFFENTKIKKIYSKNHQNYVETENNEVYAFGSNSFMQLAHEDIYSNPQNAFPIFYKPVKFNKYLDANECGLQDIVMGDEFTLFLCKNKINNLTQVYGTGVNLNGQLGNGSTRHIQEFHKIDMLSDFTITTENGEKPLNYKKISCGTDHCLAHLEIGSLLVWGSNQYGQVGNKKRTMAMSPLIVSALKDKKIQMIKADGNSNYVLTEN